MRKPAAPPEPDPEPPPLSLEDRASIIWNLSGAYSTLIDSGAPSDLVAGVAYWLRTASREGLNDEDLEHVLNAVNVVPMSKKSEG